MSRAASDCRFLGACENGHGDCTFPIEEWKRDKPRPTGIYGYDCTQEQCMHYVSGTLRCPQCNRPQERHESYCSSCGSSFYRRNYGL